MRPFPDAGSHTKPGIARAGVAICQIGIALTGFAAIAFWPAAGRDLLLVPVTSSLNATIDLALTHDARLSGRGPLQSSVQVKGDVGRLVGAMLRQGTIVIGIPSALCAGESPKSRVAA